MAIIYRRYTLAVYQSGAGSLFLIAFLYDKTALGWVWLCPGMAQV